MKFKSWFKDQFGKVPHMSESRRELLLKRVQLGKNADTELLLHAMLKDKWEAALYAWNVGDKEKR